MVEIYYYGWCVVHCTVHVMLQSHCSVQIVHSVQKMFRDTKTTCTERNRYTVNWAWDKNESQLDQTYFYF